MRRIALTALGFALLLSGVQLYSQTNAAAENAISISDGMVAKGKQQILKSMVDPGCVVNSFSLSDFSYLWLDKNTTVMTYTATQDASCSGKKQAGSVIATSVWQKQKGKWMSAFHQETTAEGM